MITIKDYVMVESLDEAYQLNQKKRNCIVAGMCWLKMQTRRINTAIDMSKLGLDYIEETDDFFKIGAMTSLRDIERHEGLKAYYGECIYKALSPIVGVQFRNLATLGGSISMRFGFSDVLTIFMALDAEVELYDQGKMPIEEFAKRQIGRDILISVKLKKQDIRTKYISVRNSANDFPLIAIGLSRLNGGYLAVVGARPERASLIRDEEEILSGPLSEEKAKKFAAYVCENIKFGNNLRGQAEYRKEITRVHIKRAVMAMGQGGKYES